MKKLSVVAMAGGLLLFLISKEESHLITKEFVGLVVMMYGAITYAFLCFTLIDGKLIRHRKFSRISGSIPLNFVETITKFDGSVVVVARMLWDKKRIYGEEGKLCVIEGVPEEILRKLKPGEGF